MRDSAIFYRSFYEAIKELPPQNQAEVYAAVFEYALNFKTVELSGLSKTIFTLIKPQIDANIKRFKNGSKAKQKRNTSKSEANNNGNNNNKENVKENENVNNNAREELFPFIDFWNLYNKKTEHSVCEAKWKVLSNKDKQLIMEKLPAYIATTPEVHFRKNPATFLAYRIWEDEHLPAIKPKEEKSAFEKLVETGSYE